MAFNNVQNKIPDRRENLYNSYDEETEIGELDTETSANYRYFQKFTDDEYAANISASKLFGAVTEKEYKLKVTLGYSGKAKERVFNSYQYNHEVQDALGVHRCK